MSKPMSLHSRRELLCGMRKRYQAALRADKSKIIDEITMNCGYDRKYAIRLLNSTGELKPSPARHRSSTYNNDIRQALYTVWYAANQICSKRLVPFLPQLVENMEQHGHLKLTATHRAILLGISRSTMDRLLQTERRRIGKSRSTTTTGKLLKHQIEVRTFADWDDVQPGFFESDLVAHCGGDTRGSFINTLVLVDVSTGWIECLALLHKSADNVIDGFNVATELLPFPLLGIDVDNGSEFINHDVINYCDARSITFTRSRAYRKNDQAFVEEKNGSVVRRLIGYDRYEGHEAWVILMKLYRVLRLYVNFFQPSLKLLSKERRGALVSKKYDEAKTPCQRVLLSTLGQEVKDRLKQQYHSLDAVTLLAEIEVLQNQLWKHAVGESGCIRQSRVQHKQDQILKDVNADNTRQELTDEQTSNALSHDCIKHKRFYRRHEKQDGRKAPRTWRTRPDPFADVWDELQSRLEYNPQETAAALLRELITDYPDKFHPGHRRTLQRRISDWRQNSKGHERKMKAVMLGESEQLLS